MKYAFLLALPLLACGESETIIVDQYVECKDYCGDDGVRDFIKSDSGFHCFCNIEKKD